jgi:hypothetical protein
MVTVVAYGKDEIYRAKTMYNCIRNEILLLHFTE